MSHHRYRDYTCEGTNGLEGCHFRGGNFWSLPVTRLRLLAVNLQDRLVTVLRHGSAGRKSDVGCSSERRSDGTELRCCPWLFQESRQKVHGCEGFEPLEIVSTSRKGSSKQCWRDQTTVDSTVSFEATPLLPGAPW
jgi:hypothetical protein